MRATDSPPNPPRLAASSIRVRTEEARSGISPLPPEGRRGARPHRRTRSPARARTCARRRGRARAQHRLAWRLLCAAGFRVPSPPGSILRHRNACRPLVERPGRAGVCEQRQKVPTFETARPSAAMTSGEPPADGNQSFDGRTARAGPAVASLAGRASRSVWPHAGPGPIRVSQALGDRTPALARPDHGGDGAAGYVLSLSLGT